MGGFYRFVIKRSINMVIVLFATLVLTIALLGPTMDKILSDAIRYYVVDEVSHGSLKFKTAEERQQYIDAQIERQIKTTGLDEPWYAPKRFANTVLKVMVLDPGVNVPPLFVQFPPTLCVNVLPEKVAPLLTRLSVSELTTIW